MHTRHKALIAGGAAAAALTSLVAAQPAAAAGAAAAKRANVTVTIAAEGVDIHGTVRSPRPKRCAAERTVKVYRLVDGEPHLWVTDTTQLQDGRYVWSIGNTGTEGRYFAKVAAKPGCKPAKSRTITAEREN